MILGTEDLPDSTTMPDIEGDVARHSTCRCQRDHRRALIRISMRVLYSEALVVGGATRFSGLSVTRPTISSRESTAAAA